MEFHQLKKSQLLMILHVFIQVYLKKNKKNHKHKITQAYIGKKKKQF